MSIFSIAAYTTLTGEVVALPIGVNIRQRFKTLHNVAVTIGGKVTLFPIGEYLNRDHAVQAAINLLRETIQAGAAPGRFKQKKNSTAIYNIKEVGVVLTKSTGRYRGKESTIAHTLYVTYPDIENDKMSRKHMYLGTQDTWEAVYPHKLQEAITFRRTKMAEYTLEFLSRLPTIVPTVLTSQSKGGHHEQSP